MSWTQQELEWTYDQARNVYEKRVSKNEACEKLGSLMPRRSKSSFGIYIDSFSYMLKGDPISRSASKDMFEFFIKKIADDYPALVKNALTAVLGYVKYDYESTGNKNISIRDMLEEYAAKYNVSIDLSELYDVTIPVKKRQKKGSVLSEKGNKESIKESVDYIEKYIISKGFKYDGNVLKNYYLSIKAKPFVILAGISGTGKSKLVELFAEACGATEKNGQYKLVPVRPDWSDSTDLFGHMNLNGKFVAGSVIDFVKKATDNLDKPYFLCLDEMNLARVEYYFSDFLSIIETRKRAEDKGNITSSVLINKSLWDRDEDAVKEYGNEDLCLPSNLYVIGTVNMDETTFPFSKKVLDRANTIEFNEVNLMPQAKLDSGIEPLNCDNSFLKTEYLKLDEINGRSEYVSGICEELEKINSILKKSNSQVAYRVRDELVSYRVLNSNYGLMSEEEAMDYEIKQKILPRLQGSSSRVKETLFGLFKICAGNFENEGGADDPDLASKMRAKVEKQDASLRYKRSAAKLVDMVERFEEDGFTSFWA